MREYFTEHHAPYTFDDWMHDCRLREVCFLPHEFHEYQQKMYHRIGQPIVYFLARENPEEQNPSLRKPQELVKVWLNDIDLFAGCLEFLNGGQFPQFKITDVAVFEAAKKVAA